MQSLLKTVVAAVSVGVVLAGAVILYVEYKIDQVTQAVVTPIVDTRERVGQAVEDVGSSVTSVVDSGADVVDDVVSTVRDFSGAVDSTVTASSNRAERLAEDVAASIRSSVDRTERALNHGTDVVERFWNSTGSKLMEGWNG